MLQMSRLILALYILFSSGFLFTGCSTLHNISIVHIEVLEPARFEIPDTVKNIGIVNRLPMLNDTVLNQGAKLKSKSDLYTTHPLTNNHAELYIRILKEILESSGRFEKIVEIDEKYISDSDSLTIEPVSNEEIFKIRNSNPDLDYLFFLDLLTNDELTIFLSNLGLYRKEILFTTLLQIAVTNPETETYYYNKTDTLRWEGEAFTTYEMKRNLPSNEEAVFAGLEESANMFAKIFVPHWERVERMMYMTGNFEMKIAQKLALENDWTSAAAIWTKFVDNKNRNIRAKATYNLALSNEIIGDMNTAFEWILKSYFVFEESNPEHAFNTKEYIRVLAKRKNDIKKLDKQLTFKD